MVEEGRECRNSIREHMRFCIFSEAAAGVHATGHRFRVSRFRGFRWVVFTRSGASYKHASKDTGLNWWTRDHIRPFFEGFLYHSCKKYEQAYPGFMLQSVRCTVVDTCVS